MPQTPPNTGIQKSVEPSNTKQWPVIMWPLKQRAEVELTCVTPAQLRLVWLQLVTGRSKPQPPNALVGSVVMVTAQSPLTQSSIRNKTTDLEVAVHAG